MRSATRCDCRTLPPLLALGGVVVALGCQSMLGFEDFSGETAEGTVLSSADGGEKTLESAADASPPSKSGRDGGMLAVGGGSAGAGGANPDEGGAGEGEGDACGTDEDCADPLVCLFSRCRVKCNNETECASGSLCLFSAVKRGGCRVAGEAECNKSGVCDNAQLVCGLDESCRVECGPSKSCDSPTQVCVAGSCVSTVGDDQKLFDCGAAKAGEVVCEGAKLMTCNTLTPGLAEIAKCESAAVCTKSIPPGGDFDKKHPPECGAACPAGELYCDGATLNECKQDGSGPVDDGDACATTALCKQALEKALSQCPAPVCEENELRCAGGQTALEGQSCNQGKTAFEAVDLCDPADLQCNPGTAKCFSLKIDSKEVSQADYVKWLAGSPDVSTQAAGCEWNKSFAQPVECIAVSTCDAALTDQCPAHCVDWCDAAAYCGAKGRRLCGKIGGGMVALDRLADPGTSEWMNACSAGGQFVYGAGNMPPETEPNACRFAGNSSGKTYPSGTHSACASPARGYAKMFDFSGNVAEWENACERAVNASGAGPKDVCLARGGSYGSELEFLECAKVPKATVTRDTVSPAIGFRCCAD